jgi:hypothetical protein
LKVQASNYQAFCIKKKTLQHSPGLIIDVDVD